MVARPDLDLRPMDASEPKLLERQGYLASAQREVCGGPFTAGLHTPVGASSGEQSLSPQRRAS